jgi:hypothetical protein
MRQKVTKNSFSSGEISPLLKGRTDIQQYNDAVEKLNNYLIRQQGGISKRPGTRYIGEVLDQTAALRLQKFVYNTEQGYMLEFSPLKIRVLRDEGFVTEASSATTGATQADPVVISDTTHAYVDGDIITISGVGGMTELNGKNYIVNNSSAGVSYEIQDMLGTNIDGTGFGAYTTAGISERHVVIATPYTATQIETLSFAQSNDVLYIASESHQPRKVSRTSDTVWTIEEVDNKDGPYGAENLTATTLTPSATTGSITVTASDNLFASTDVDRVVRLHHDGSTPIAGWGRITAYSTATSVTVSLGSDLGATTATEVWRLGAWSSTTGYSSTITFHENRLWFGGTTNEPNTFWGSKTDDYENFEPTEPDTLVVSDNNGLRFQISSDQSNAIQWMKSGPIMFIGTKGGQYAVKSSGAAITPSDVSVKRQNGYGSSIVEPHFIANSLLYNDRSTRKIMEMVYNYDADSYESREISVISNHILRQGTRAIYTSYQQTPDNVIWYTLEDGGLVGMTFLKEQKIIAFHNHEMAGTYESETVTSGYVIEDETYIIKSTAGGADFTTIGASANTVGVSFVATEINPTWGSGSLARVTKAQVMAIGTIPSSNGLYDVTYVVVKRTINGNTHQYIEYMTDDEWAEHDQDKDGMFYVDSGLSYSGAAITTLTGLDHLEGEVVSVVSNDATHPDRTVASGSITLQESATSVKVGYGYVANCKLLPPSPQGDLGSSQGSQKRTSELTIRLWNSLGLQIGSNLTNLDEVVFRSSTDRMDQSPPLFTGDKKQLMPDNYDTEGSFYLRQDKPFPCNILFVTYEMRSNK